jgi:hypothetical protein
MTSVTQVYKAIYNLIASDTTISDQVNGRIFSNPPEDVSYPMITIADIASDYMAYTGYYGAKNLIKVEVLSKVRNNIECLELMDRIAKLFANCSLVSGDNILSGNVLSSNIYQDKAARFWVGEVEIELISLRKH